MGHRRTLLVGDGPVSRVRCGPVPIHAPTPFVADNYAPFFSTPIECTDRDAATVLDGLLYNESDLELEEHYTDTHGYTDINFAAFAMLGRRFSPRIRSLKKQRLYRVDTRDYGKAAFHQPSVMPLPNP